MKKLLAILVAVLIIAVSAVPAFAAVDSPKPTQANYQITIVPVPGGGTYDFEVKKGVDDKGEETIHFSAKPEDGYKFTGWTFEGDYTLLGNATDAELDIIARSDIKATPHFEKIGGGGSEDKPVNVDDSSKSPKTGYDSHTYAVLAASTLAVIGLIFIARRRKVK